MTDRVPTYPGRVRLTPVSGQENIYDMERADSPEKEGTPQNKNTFLKDATAAKFGLAQEDPTVDDAFNANTLLQGEGKPTTATPGAIGQIYYGGKNFGFYMCLAHITGEGSTSYVWASMNPSAAAFGTRGPIVFAESGTFKIADYGLSVGDSVNVICIGGGGGGAAGQGYNSTKDYYYGDDGAGSGTNGGYGSGGDGGSASAGFGDLHALAAGGGGGGSGFVASGTVTLNAEEITVTIGAGGVGETIASDGTREHSATDGGATSFGDLLTAEGGKKGTSSVSVVASSAGGDGGHPGTAGDAGSTGGVTYSGGYGGAGWNITGTFTYGTQASPNIQGAGACFIWY